MQNYASLQGYQCRIICAPINDHTWTEVKIDGEWTRVDASLSPNDTRAINYPLFFEKEKGWNPPIFALAFDGSSIVDVTPTYRSNGWSLFSLINIFFIGFALWLSFCFYLIFMRYKEIMAQPKKLIRYIKRRGRFMSKETSKKKITKVKRIPTIMKSDSLYVSSKIL